MKILLANPRGFCAGVDRAISIVERALEMYQPPIYVRHEVVHNRFVVEGLKQRGAIFVEELHEVPDDNIVIFSAHGVSQVVRQEAKRRKLTVFDATCPLVTKVHMEVARASRRNMEVVLITMLVIQRSKVPWGSTTAVQVECILLKDLKTLLLWW